MLELIKDRNGEMTYHANGTQGKKGHENLEDLHLNDIA